MALEFTDFGLSPEDRVAQREQALQSYKSNAIPAMQRKTAAERGNLIADMQSQVAKAAQAGQIGAASGALGEAMQKAAQMTSQQGIEKDAAAMQAAEMGLDISGARRGATADAYNQQTEIMKAQSADYIAKQAFANGYTARELAIHRNGYLADKGLQQMYYDLEQGRLSRDEVFATQAAFQKDALRMQQETQAMLKELDNQLKLDIQAGNIAAAKNRLTAIANMQKEAARKAAEAASLGAMISGGFMIGGGIIGGIIGKNPASVAAGASAGGALASGVNKARS